MREGKDMPGAVVVRSQTLLLSPRLTTRSPEHRGEARWLWHLGVADTRFVRMAAMATKAVCKRREMARGMLTTTRRKQASARPPAFAFPGVDLVDSRRAGICRSGLTVRYQMLARRKSCGDAVASLRACRCCWVALRFRSSIAIATGPCYSDLEHCAWGDRCRKPYGTGASSMHGT